MGIGFGEKNVDKAKKFSDSVAGKVELERTEKRLGLEVVLAGAKSSNFEWAMIYLIQEHLA